MQQYEESLVFLSNTVQLRYEETIFVMHHYTLNWSTAFHCALLTFISGYNLLQTKPCLGDL